MALTTFASEPAPERLQTICTDLCERIAAEHGCAARVSRRPAVQSAADGLGLRNQTIASGALHDASNIAALAPATMIFVPCRDRSKPGPFYRRCVMILRLS